MKKTRLRAVLLLVLFLAVVLIRVSIYNRTDTNGDSVRTNLSREQIESFGLEDWRRVFIPSYSGPHSECLAAQPKRSDIFREEKKEFIKKELEFLQSYDYLTKKVFNSKPKVVFVAGAEGSGHHFMASAWERICSEKESPNSFCYPETSFNSIVLCHEYQREQLNPRAIGELRLAARQYKGKLMIVNTFGESGQMHSYPFCKSKEKIANPNIRQLAELYESAGFDFRVVLLDRTPESSMASLLISRGMRHKQQLMWQAQEMTAGLQALNMQLSKLDPRFLAGAVSLERRKRENKDNAYLHLEKSLSLSSESVKKMFKGFQSKEPQCIDSANEDQTQLEKHLVDLYKQYYKYHTYVSPLLS